LKAVSVVKGAGDCTYILEQGTRTSVPWFPVDRVVDTVGAGDGFCAGFLAGLLRGFPLAEAVRIGNLVGALVVQAPGDWEGLPTWAQVEAALHNRTHIER
jgi:2-dehydro-3-deoxygluconokinase